MWVIGILKISKEQIRQRNRPTQNQIHHIPPLALSSLLFSDENASNDYGATEFNDSIYSLFVYFRICCCLLLSRSVVYFSSFAAN